MAQKRSIVQAAKASISQSIGTFQFFGSVIVGLKKANQFNAASNVDGQDFTITLNPLEGHSREKETF